MPTREAIFINPRTSQPILHLDPIDLEVTADGLAVDVDNASKKVFDTLVAYHDQSNPPLVVWSDSRVVIKFVCLSCAITDHGYHG